MLFNLKDQWKIVKKKHDSVFNTENMLPVSEIKQDTIILKDWWLRAILKITWLNLDLKNSDEQQIVLEQYKRFLNWLDFPVQILIRNTYLDLSNYINYVKANIVKVDNLILQNQWKNYAKFLEDIDLKQWLIYNKEFYIVVPYYEWEADASKINKAWYQKFLDVLNSKDSAEKVIQRYRGFLRWRKMLETRCNVIIDWLSSFGIWAEKLWVSDIISLLFRMYNPMIHNAQSELAEKLF